VLSGPKNVTRDVLLARASSALGLLCGFLGGGGPRAFWEAPGPPSWETLGLSGGGGPSQSPPRTLYVFLGGPRLQGILGCLSIS
jgi:hypothetical protein